MPNAAAFRTELTVRPMVPAIRQADQVLLMGSCFTEHMAGFLQKHQVRQCQNPFGILFNPVSIAEGLQLLASGCRFQAGDLFQHADLWYSWRHHGRFAGADMAATLAGMQREADHARGFARQARWAIITLGSAWAYELQETAPGYRPGQIAANCHKLAATHFTHRLLSLAAITGSLDAIAASLRSLQPDIRIIFTVSPVRHAREGLVENNRSKALLLTALHPWLEQQEGCTYFPAYELVMDDLRDYRFYAEDMVHPNYQATRYVWEKFREACMDSRDAAAMDEAFRVQSAAQHRPLHPGTPAHHQFVQKTLEKIAALEKENPWMDFSAAKSMLKIPPAD